MKKEHRTKKESYRIRTHLVHGNYEASIGTLIIT